MSPHMDNRFEGHMEQGDPRDLMWACGGCTSPTIMAYNFLVCSTNAWGVLSFLNNVGIELIPNTPWGSSWEFWWKLRESVPWVTVALLKKTYPFNGHNYRLELQATTGAGVFFSDTVFPAQKCNVTHMLTPAEVGFPVPLGGTGDGFRLMQVEWDEQRPPGGWPP